MVITTQFFSLLQKLFYESRKVYLFSYDDTGKPCGEWMGSKEEAHYVGSIMEEEAFTAGKRFSCYGMEEIIPIETRIPYAAVYLLMWRYNEQQMGSTYVCGFIDDEIPAGEGVPSSIVRTTRQELEQTIDYLAQLGKMYIQAAAQVEGEQKAREEAVEAKNKVEQDYLRSALMTEIVQQLEVEEEITVVVREIFEKVCSYLGIEEARLYQLDQSRENALLVTSWDLENVLQQEEESRPVTFFPFMDGLTYTISANSRVNQVWRDYLANTHIRAMVSMPVYMNNQVIMYVTFQCRKQHRIWSVADSKFLYDVKKIIQSIVVRHRAKNALHSSLDSLKEILQNIGCEVFVLDTDGKTMLFQNGHFGEDFLERIGSKEEFCQSFKGDNKEKEIYLEPTKEWFKVQHSIINWVDNRAVSLFTVHNITQMKEYEQNMEHSINSDFLTGLYNRMRCEADIRLYLEMTKNYGGEGALFFIDLDDFKHINDGLGHQYGDILLKEISSDLRKIPGIESTCYRVGGDEFMVIVANNAYDRIGSIIAAIEDMFSRPWFLKGADYYCTMSMGVCKFPTDADTVEDIIRKADVALLEAKKSGKNRVEYYDNKVSATDLKRLDMEKFMRDACINPAEEFEVYYQPIIDISLEGNPCVGAEALVRWNSKFMGKISPTEFVPLAEYLGLINPIGQYVLEEACIHCKYWNDMGHPEYKVNVNFSVVQLLQNEMLQSLERVLKRTGINPQNLTIEVTESLAVNDMNYMKKLLGDMKKLGIRVALDDFGTGYSSLNHIREMPLDIIKVDRCFVKDIGKDDYSQVFVKMVSELAKAMGLNVCVEGVEEEIQYEILKKQEINMIQGFYFSEPIPLEEFERKYLS